MADEAHFSTIHKSTSIYIITMYYIESNLQRHLPYLRTPNPAAGTLCEHSNQEEKHIFLLYLYFKKK